MITEIVLDIINGSDKHYDLSFFNKELLSNSELRIDTQYDMATKYHIGTGDAYEIIDLLCGLDN
jgi:hypothetical protein